MSEASSTTVGEAFPIGSKEMPDAAGVVRRGKAVRFTSYVEKYEETPVCFVGEYGEKARSMAPPACERPAVMEVYGITMCEVHGEEAASGAMEEIAYDLENELQRPINGYVRPLSPHLERALRHGFETLPADADDTRRADAALLEAFPLDRARVSSEILAYVEDGEGRGTHEPPYDMYMSARLLLHRHMRLAYEEDAFWLVEMLEREREAVAAQVAYTLALGREAGPRPVA